MPLTALRTLGAWFQRRARPTKRKRFHGFVTPTTGASFFPRAYPLTLSGLLRILLQPRKLGVSFLILHYALVVKPVRKSKTRGSLCSRFVCTRDPPQPVGAKACAFSLSSFSIKADHSGWIHWHDRFKSLKTPSDCSASGSSNLDKAALMSWEDHMPIRQHSSKYVGYKSTFSCASLHVFRFTFGGSQSTTTPSSVLSSTTINGRCA